MSVAEDGRDWICNTQPWDWGTGGRGRGVGGWLLSGVGSNGGLGVTV